MTNTFLDRRDFMKMTGLGEAVLAVGCCPSGSGQPAKDRQSDKTTLQCR